MENGKKCNQCGTEISPVAPQGLCPKCLMRAGFDTQPAACSGIRLDGFSATPSGGFVPPLPEELADQFPSLDIIELIGCGGMGMVYKCRQKQLDRLAALKILPPEIVAGQPSFAERFTREAQSMAKLSHPNIVSVFDFGQTPAGLFYFVMEYVDGTDLRHIIEAGSLSPAQALAIVPQICQALQFAHDKGIIHRDIKPENILLDKTGTVKITDFGLAGLMVKPAGAFTLTHSLQRMGTPLYMAPEQIEHPHKVDQRADIYSLGVVFYEMLTGELPLGKFSLPSQKVGVDVRLDEVVLHTLEKEPERRYQHASEVKTDLEAIVSDSNTSIPHPKETTIHRRFSRSAIIGACLAPLALFAVLPPFFKTIVYLFHFYKGPGSGISVADLMIALLGLLGFSIPFVTTILGFTSISSIRRSAGRMCGMGLAVFDGLLFPLLALDAVIFFVLALLALLVRIPRVLPFSAMTFAAVLVLPTAAVVDFIIAKWTWRKINIDSKPVQKQTGRKGSTPQKLRIEPAGEQAGLQTRTSELSSTKRFSRCAIVGACWSGLILFWIPVAIIYLSEIRPSDLEEVIMVSCMLIGSTPVFATTILGMISIIHIRQSQGRLYGMGLALYDALLFPIIILDILLVVGSAVNFVQFVLEEYPIGRFLPLIAFIACPVLDYFIIRWAWRKANAGTQTASGV